MGIYEIYVKFFRFLVFFIIISFECLIIYGYFFNLVNNIIIIKGFSVYIYVKWWY